MFCFGKESWGRWHGHGPPAEPFTKIPRGLGRHNSPYRYAYAIWRRCLYIQSHTIVHWVCPSHLANCNAFVRLLWKYVRNREYHGSHNTMGDSYVVLSTKLPLLPCWRCTTRQHVAAVSRGAELNVCSQTVVCGTVGTSRNTSCANNRIQASQSSLNSLKN